MRRPLGRGRPPQPRIHRHATVIGTGHVGLVAGSYLAEVGNDVDRETIVITKSTVPVSTPANVRAESSHFDISLPRRWPYLGASASAGVEWGHEARGQVTKSEYEELVETVLGLDRLLAT